MQFRLLYILTQATAKLERDFTDRMGIRQVRVAKPTFGRVFRMPRHTVAKARGQLCLILLLSGLFSFGGQTGEAVTATSLLDQWARQYAELKSLSGVIIRTETTVVGEEKWEEKFTFSAPDRFRCESVKVEGEGPSVRQVLVCDGGESWLVFLDTEVVKHWKSNLFSDWVQLAGGPANVGGFLTDISSLSRRYSSAVMPVTRAQEESEHVIELTEKEPQILLVRDFVRGGGTFPLMEYLVYKQKRFLRPLRVRLHLDGENRLTLREHLDETGQVILRARCSKFVQLGKIVFPASWEIYDRFGHLVTVLEYRDLQLNPPVPNSAFDPLLSSRMVLEEQLPQSLAEARQRVQQQPDNADAHFQLALTTLRHLEDVPATLRHLNEVIRLRPQAVAPWVLATELYAGSGDLDNALIAAQQALRLSPKHPQVRELAVQVLTRKNRLTDAVACLREAMENDPRNPHWHLLLGEIYQRLGKFDEAAAAYRLVIEGEGLTPSTVDQLAAAEDLLILTRWTEMNLGLVGRTPVAIKAMAESEWRAGRLAEAQQKYEQAAQVAPKNSLLMMSIAGSLLRHGELGRAAELLNRIVERHRGSDLAVEALRALMGIAIEQQDWSKAWDLFRQLMEDVNTQRQGNYERRLFIEAFQKRFSHDALVKFLEAECGKNTKDENAYRLLAELYLGEGDRARAIATLRAGTYRLPENPTLRSILVDQLVAEARAASPDSRERQRKFEEAQREAERLCRADPFQPYFQAQLAFLLQFQGRRGFAQALATAQGLTGKFPDDPDSYATLATIYLDRAWEPTSALSNYQKALEMGVSYQERHEEVFYIRQGIAAVHQQSGSLEKVLQEYQRLLNRCPDAQERLSLYSNLMVILTRNQRLDLALDYLHSLLNTEISSEEKRLVINFLFSSLGKKKEFDEPVREHIRVKMNAHPDDPYWTLFDAITKILLGEKAAGLAAYEKAAAQAASDPVILEWLADWYFVQQDYAAAARHYRRALSLDQTNPGIYMRLAIAEWKSGERNAPAQLARQMMVCIPNDVDAFVTLGTLFRETGRNREAADALQEAARLCRWDAATGFSKTISVDFDLASTLTGAGRYAEAEVVLKRLTSRECGLANRVAAYRGLAALYNQQQRTQDAVAALQQAIQLLAPSDSALRGSLEKEIRDLQQRGAQ